MRPRWRPDSRSSYPNSEAIMNSLAKILLPVDFSERSALAVRYARELALHFHCELILAHALPPLHSEFGMQIAGSMLVDVYRSRTDQAERDLNAFEPDALAGLNVRRLLLHGVHIEEARPTAAPFSRILCAVDLGPQSARALAWASWLQREFHGHLTLIHAIAAHAESLDEPDLSWRSGIREIAEEELLRLQREIGAEADLLLEAGEPARIICSAAARVGADFALQAEQFFFGDLANS